MNTKNNKRRKESVEKIKKAFIELIQNKEINEITVSDICKMAQLNRSTFYANFLDIYDLADKLRIELEKEVEKLYSDEITHNYNSNNYLKLFQHIKDNQIFYNTYFKLGFDNQPIKIYDYHLADEIFGGQHIEYHIEFFRAGFNAIIKKWLSNGCKETPEEMKGILTSEYKNR